MARQLMYGLKAAILEANEKEVGAGLIGAANIVLDTLDDNYDPNITEPDVRYLLNKGVLGFIGVFGSDPVVRAYTVLSEVGHGDTIPLIGSLTGTVSLFSPNFKRNVINIRVSYRDEVFGMIDFAMRKFQLSRFSCFYQNDAFGLSGYSGVVDSLARVGMKIESWGSFDRVTFDLAPGWANVSKGHPEAIVLFMTGQPAASFMTLFRSQKVMPIGNVKLFLPAVANDMYNFLSDSEKVFDDIDVYMTQITPIFNNYDVPLTQIFRDALTKYNSSVIPDNNAYEGYLNGRLFISVLEKMSPDSLADTDQFRVDFLNTLYNNPVTKISGITLGPYSDDCTAKGFYACCNQGLRQVTITKLSNGTYLQEDISQWQTCAALSNSGTAPIKVGHSFNANDPRSEAIKDGIWLAFSEENSDPELGKVLTIISYNDQGNTTVTANNFLELIQKDQVDAIVAPTDFLSSQIASRICTSNSVPLIAPVSGDPTLRKPHNPLNINHRVSIYDEAAAMINYCQQKGFGTLFIISANDNEGTVGREGLSSAILLNNNKKLYPSNIDIRVVGEIKVAIEANWSLSFSSLQLANPSAVIFFGGYQLADIVFNTSVHLAVNGAPTFFFPSYMADGNITVFRNYSIVITDSIPHINRTAFDNFNTSQIPSDIVDEFYASWITAYGTVFPQQQHFEGYLIAKFLISVFVRMNDINSVTVPKAVYDIQNFAILDYQLGPFGNCTSGGSCQCNQGRQIVQYFTVDSTGELKSDNSVAPYTFSCTTTFSENRITNAGFIYDQEVIAFSTFFLSCNSQSIVKFPDFGAGICLCK